MILCPLCNNPINGSDAKSLSCSDCKLKMPIVEGLISFHSDKSGKHEGMDSKILDDLVSHEDNHFWMNARKDLIKSVFDRYVSSNEKIIEIGAGTGNVTRHLIEKGYKNFSVGEVHLSGLEYAKSYGVKERYQFDLTMAPFKEHFDVVCMFDVLEHIDAEVEAIRNIHKMLKVKGRVIVTVPAHNWLWNKQDSIASHRRRYERDQLKKLFETNGFKVLKATAFFVSILPLLYLRTIFDKDDGVVKENDLKDRFKINPIINNILKLVLNMENRLLAHSSLRWGGSILLVAEKL